MNTDSQLSNTTAPTQIGQCVFRLEDCQDFGRISGDFNPLHVDSLYGRKSIAGESVVHGVLVLLTALDSVFAAGVPKPSRINAQFRKFVCVGDEVIFHLVKKGEMLKVSASVANRLCSEITLSYAPAQGAPSAKDSEKVEWMIAPGSMEHPVDVPPGQHSGKTYAVDLKQYGSMKKFPHCEKILGVPETRALCASTYFVGMICPGLNSIYSALDLEVLSVGTETPAQRFFMDRFDERTGRYEISTRGVLAGKITAFRRPELVAQEPISAYQSRVTKGEFSKLNALIIGGSRGLGAAAAKILAAGGAEVAITYAKGRADAETVANEVERACGTKTQLVSFDVLQDDPKQLEASIARANVLLYFATPKIRTGKLKGFERDLFDTFVRFYIEKPMGLFTLIESLKQKKTVYLPSTVFVESIPPGFLEYAMAKSAAELLCKEVNATFTYARAVTTRLPRMKTDQTASLFELKYESIFDNLYPILKTMAEDNRGN